MVDDLTAARIYLRALETHRTNDMLRMSYETDFRVVLDRLKGHEHYEELEERWKVYRFMRYGESLDTTSE